MALKNSIISQQIHGSLNIFLVVFLFFFVISGFSIWGLFRDWKQQMSTQLRLNECVGKIALSLMNTLNQIERLNQRIQQLRLSILSAHLTPEIIPTLHGALLLVVTQQNMIYHQWEFKRTRWNLTQGCGILGDQAFFLNPIPLIRKPPDEIGLKPLEWIQKEPDIFFFQLQNGSRKTSAKVQKSKASQLSYSAWEAFWSAPK